MVFDDVKYREVSNLVRNIELGWVDFEIDNIPYVLMTCESKSWDGSPNGKAAEYHHPEDVWAIYLWEDIGEKIQRPLLFHEIVEIYHREQEMEMTPAHNATMPWEKRFCEDYLTNVELERYLQFKKEHSCNGFDLSDKKE